jgi:hypothetical protein
MLINMIRAIAAFLMIGSMSAAAQEHAGHGGPSQPTPGVLDRVRPQEASGTAWQPADTPMSGFHFRYQGWDFMAHAAIFAGIDWQEGDRGDNAMISTNWIMLMGRHPLGPGEISLRGMSTLEPWTVEDRGYPLLLQSGETIHDVPIHDRQHPHDLFMELSAGWSTAVTPTLGAQVYAAIVGEPALGPVAFMHRFSASADPFPPLGHHWEDSTHISAGVLTAGLFTSVVKLEGSWFNGREPDETRIDLDLNVPDSLSVRLSVNPAPAWSFQVSTGRLDEPEALEPGVSVRRTTASATVTGKLDDRRSWSATAVWGRNDPSEGPTTDAFLAEGIVEVDLMHTVFGRLEALRKSGRDLALDPTLDDETFGIASLSLGYIYNFTRMEGQDIGLGVRLTANLLDADLEAAYGGRVMFGIMLFLRLRPTGSMEDGEGGHHHPR